MAWWKTGSAVPVETEEREKEQFFSKNQEKEHKLEEEKEQSSKPATKGLSHFSSQVSSSNRQSSTSETDGISKLSANLYQNLIFTGSDKGVSEKIRQEHEEQKSKFTDIQFQPIAASLVKDWSLFGYSQQRV